MASAVASIFQEGKVNVQSYEKKETDASCPPKPLLIVTPTQAGSYPVIIFLHGYHSHNCYYRQLIEHIASHGYIAVAPQLSLSPLPPCNGDAESEAGAANSSLSSSNEDIDSAAAVINWLPGGLQAVVPEGVQANLHKLGLAGHSKGGHTAFCLATRKYAKVTLDFSVLLGIDPVAGFQDPQGIQIPVWPRILTCKPNSFDINIPILVVGAGLGDEELPQMPPCAPAGLNHVEFFKESKTPCNYFVVKDYGHLDMLDDDAPSSVLTGCKCGGGCRGKMRRSIAGLAIAFMEAYLDGNRGDLAAVVAHPSVAPATLDPVEEK